MAEGQRSPFGDLVVKYRNILNLTQLELASLASTPSPGHDRATVSERTISAIEQSVTPRRNWVRSRPSTVRALATAFGLEPGTADYDAFLRAAKATNQQAQSPASQRQPTPTGVFAGKPKPAPLFVPDGREFHLERLRQAVDRAVSGQPGAIFVAADPGGGKTSLIEEACRQAVARHNDLTVLWGDCTGRSGAADPHQPFRQILGVLVGDTTAAGPQQLITAENEQRIRSRIAVAIESVVDEGHGLIDRFIPAETLRTQGESAELDRDAASRLHRALETSAGLHAHALGPNEQVVRVLARYAAATPLILVLEDLHWADVGTASMLFHLMRRMRELALPLLVIGSLRPSDLEPGGLGNRHSLPSVLMEAPRLFDNPMLDLSTAVGGQAGRAFVDAMVAATSPDAPSSLREALFAQTAGLPLFVTAMLRWFQAEGTGQSGPGNLPTEIDVLFKGLVTRLPHDVQSLLNAASVQGNIFSAEVVMRVMGLSRPTLIEMVDHQLTRRFRALTEGGASTVAGQRSHEYQFAHALFRNYLYSRMTDLERAHYHAATADAMLDLYGPDHHDATAPIAYHLDQSGDRLRAAAAYLRAGNHNLNLSRFERAQQLFARIRELKNSVADPFTYAHSLVGLGACARALDRRADAQALFTSAIDIAQRKHLPAVHAHALASLGMLDYDAGEVRQGSNRLKTVVGLQIESGELEEACSSMAMLSHNLHGMGEYDEAAAAARHGIDLATDLGNDMMLVGARIALANCWIDIGLFGDAISAYERCIEVSESHADAHRVDICLLNIALCHFEMAQWDRAEHAIQRMTEPGRRVEPRFIGTGEYTMGIVREGQARWKEAWDHYQASREIRQSNGQDALLVDSLAGLLRVATQRNETTAAHDLVGDISHRIERRGLDGVEHVGRLMVSLVSACQSRNDHNSARKFTKQGVAFVDERAGRLADPAHRASYLTNPPAHRRLFELATEMGISPA